MFYVDIQKWYLICKNELCYNDIFEKFKVWDHYLPQRLPVLYDCLSTKHKAEFSRLYRSRKPTYLNLL